MLIGATAQDFHDNAIVPTSDGIPMPDENEAPDTGDLENKSGAVPGLDR